MGDCDGVVMYGVCIPAASCSFVAYIPQEYQCQFTKETRDCGDEDASVAYTNYLYCNFNEHELYPYLGMLVFLMNALSYIWTLCNISDFLTPSLCYVSNAIGLSESFSGVTFLAFGNSALDLITLIVGGGKSGPEMVIIYVLGKGLFVTTVVLALVFLMARFKMFPRSVSRFSFTYMLAIVFLAAFSVVPVVQILEAMVYLVIYALYVVVFVSRDWFYSKHIHKILITTVADIVHGENQSQVLVVRRRPIDSMTPVNVPSPRMGRKIGALMHDLEEEDSASTPSGSLVPTDSQMTVFSRLYDRDTLTVEGEPTTSLHRRVGPRLGERQRATLASVEGVYTTAPVPRRRKVFRKGAVNNALDLERKRLLKLTGLMNKGKVKEPEALSVEIDGQPSIQRPENPFKDLCEHVNPIDDVEWERASSCSRIIMLIEAPLLYACKLTIPCLDEAVLLNNWCQLLNCMHCIVVPLVCLWAIDLLKYPSTTSYPILVSTLAAGLMMASFVYLTSRPNRAPPYHFLFAVAGIVSAIFLMYLCIKEVISTLYAFTNVFGIRRGWCFSVFLPWGNTASQIVNTITLTRAGFPRVAFSGCAGCAIFVTLIGVGISWCYLLSIRGTWKFSYEPEYSGMISVEMFYLMACTVSTWIILMTFSFQCRRSLGWFLLTLYAMFLIFLCACELDMLTPLLIIP